MAIGRVPGATGIQPSIVDAKGDLIVATAADSVSRLAVGSNDQVLTADSAQATGLKWAAIPASSGPAFRAFRNTSQQTFNANTQTKVQLNGETFDTDNCFDSATNYRFTPNKSGYYLITGNITFSGANATTIKEVYIFKNGSEVAKIFSSNGSGTPGSSAAIGNSDLIYMNGSSDYLELYGYDSDGAARNFFNGTNLTYFTGVWIRS